MKTLHQLLNRIEDHQSSINTINENLSYIDVAIINSCQPSDDYESLRDTYSLFWHLWRELEFEQRHRAIQLLVKEARLFSEGEEGKDKKLRLEIDLITNPNIESGGGNGDIKPLNRKKYKRKSSRKSMRSFVGDPVHYALLIINELGIVPGSFFWAVGELWAQVVTVLYNCNTVQVYYSLS